MPKTDDQNRPDTAAAAAGAGAGGGAVVLPPHESLVKTSISTLNARSLRRLRFPPRSPRHPAPWKPTRSITHAAANAQIQRAQLLLRSVGNSRIIRIGRIRVALTIVTWMRGGRVD